MRRKSFTRIQVGAALVALSCASCAAAPGWKGSELRGAPGRSEAPAAATPAASNTPAGTGFYVDVHGAWTQLGGDFDGDTALMGATEVIVVPDTDPGFGFGLAFGHRWEKVAVELAFTETQHDGEISGLFTSNDVTLDVLEVNGRYFFNTSSRFQPFLLAGLGFVMASMDDAAGPGIGEAELTGLGAGLGGGAEYYFDQHWSLGLRLLYRFASFDEAEGTQEEGSIDDSVDGHGLAAVVGATFTF